MSDSTPPTPPMPPPRGHVPRETAGFQPAAVAFIEKVVLPPMFCTAICHENELTENARARARRRGVKSGIFDLQVYQSSSKVVWIELKWGKNTPSEAQKQVAERLWMCAVPHGFAWSIGDVLDILSRSGFRLHGNAKNLAVEYQARAEALVARAEARATKPRASTPQRSTRRASPAQYARFQKARLGL